MPEIQSAIAAPRWARRLATSACILTPVVIMAAANASGRRTAPAPAPVPTTTAALPADTTPPAKAAPAPIAHAPGDPLAVNNVIYQGWKMFEVYCTRCHGEDAVGTSFAPALTRSLGPEGSIDHKAFWLTVTYGRPAKGMPTWGNLLSPEQKEDVYNYLRARAVGGMGYGRPHIIPGAKKDSTAFPPAQGNDTTFVPPFLRA
jgi:mono/diheme cytochrome c family protein